MTEFPDFIIFIIESKLAPPITGMAIKNEKLAAFLLAIPSHNARTIVLPLLETPGMMAKAWIRPIKKAVLSKIVFDDSLVYLLLHKILF